MSRKPKPRIAWEHRYESCGSCSGGWVTVHDGSSVAKVKRCWCWTAWQRKLAGEQPAPERAWTEQGVVAPGWVAARRICEAALAAVAAPKDGG